MKSQEFKKLIQEEIRKVIKEDGFGLDSSYWNVYIANKDTTIGKTKVPKGTVIHAVGGGNWQSTDKKINTHIGALLDTPGFDKVVDTTWPETVRLTKEIEEWARRTKDLMQRHPGEAQAVINGRKRIIDNIRKLLK